MNIQVNGGAPTIGVSAFVGMCAATISSIIESVGDYIATAPVCQVPPPPRHAINRSVDNLYPAFHVHLGIKV